MREDWIRISLNRSQTMGRKAKLRQQRRSGKASGQTFPDGKKSVGTNQQSIRAEVPALPQSSSPPPEKSESRSPLSRLTSLFKATPKQQALYDSGEEVGDFISEYGELLGAIAWEGYQTYGRGIVFAGPNADSTIAIEYVPRKHLRQYVGKADIKLFADTLEMSDPEKDLPLLYTTQAGETMLSANPMEPPPPECYRRRKRQETAASETNESSAD